MKEKYHDLKREMLNKKLDEFYDKQARICEKDFNTYDEIYKGVSEEEIKKIHEKNVELRLKRESGIVISKTVIKNGSYQYADVKKVGNEATKKHETYEQIVNRILEESDVNKIAEEMFRKSKQKEIDER